MLNKTELINQVGKKAGITKKDAAKAVDAIVDSVTKTLSKGEGVQLIGFGSFAVSKRAARKGRNPRTGAALNIPAHKVPVFRAGKALKKAIAKK